MAGSDYVIGSRSMVLRKKKRASRTVNLRTLCVGVIGGFLVCGLSLFSLAAEPGVSIQEYPVPKGSGPHDVAPAPDGTVWYSAQGSGELGRLDPATGQIRRVKLGDKSSPHGVIVGPDGAPWVTDGGLNAIVRVDPATEKVSLYPLPAGREGANLNTAAFDRHGVLWFTGQSGIYGELDPAHGTMRVFVFPWHSAEAAPAHAAAMSGSTNLCTCKPSFRSP